MSDCYHCGLPIPKEAKFHLNIEGQQRAMCCTGCLAVASAIIDGGLGRFYQYRSANAQRPDSKFKQAYEGYDVPDVQKQITEQLDEDLLRIRLVLGGITCAACAWLIEKHLQKIPGINAVRVNVSRHQCSVDWRPSEIKLSQVFEQLAFIGYEASPVHDEQVAELRHRENKVSLQRLGVAGMAMMQVGMVAIALYAGAFQGIDPKWENYLRWVGLFFATPVMFFSARPFFNAAWHSLKVRVLTMDVSVSLAIGLAYLASCWATISKSGEVYFDSVVMFTFFLLLGRYLEMSVRHKNATQIENMGQLLPLVAIKVEEGIDQAVPVKMLKKSDLVRIAAGDIFPCDGQIEEGASSVVEAMLTGEPHPVSKKKGDVVSAGTCNTVHPLLVRVTATGANTRLSAILNLTEEASGDRPKLAAMADSISGYFVAAVLLVSIATAIYWWQHDPQQMLWITLSVLVVTCPCALSLATPAALTVAAAELRHRGFLIKKGHVLEVLAAANRIVFDKTGTLTTGNMTIADVIPLANLPAEELISLATVLEKGSNHPIARAFAGRETPREAVDVQQHIAEGVSGSINGQDYCFGKADWVATRYQQPLAESPHTVPGQLMLLLARPDKALGWIVLQDQLRDNANSVIAQLKNEGLLPALCSGDRRVSVALMANTLSISDHYGDMTPDGKLQIVQQYQQHGDKVVMVGDGINDVPVLSGADVSIAMGSAADFAQMHADSVLLSGNLETLADVIAMAKKTRRVIRQNLGWALLYNLVALPLAVIGWVPPWAAAIGMSGSSLLVVSNALRLGSGRKPAINPRNYEKVVA